MKQSQKILLYLHTLRYLRPKQVYYQAFYRIKRIFATQRLRAKCPRQQNPSRVPLKLETSIPHRNSYYYDGFDFLNKKKSFEVSIDWDFMGHGKLWSYNLNYFDFLHQRELAVDQGIILIEDFCKGIGRHQQAAEPYTISLRGINWIKFFTNHNINNPRFDEMLYCQYKHLASNIEHHLLGNHLLENGFSMLFAAYFFQDDSFYRKAKRILSSELNEQILPDGAHFELSPMYHQIILFRLLDAINLVKSNEWKERELLTFLSEKATKMLGWLKAVTFKNGDIPMVNDAAPDIAPHPREIFEYATRLQLQYNCGKLSESGYEMIRSRDSELFVDIGSIGPDYIPGHAHSDTFNFILHVNGAPVVVDTGTSTYETGSRRQLERSTASHNTVLINDLEQSEIWGSFRVARRAKIIRSERKEGEIIASHDGYKRLGVKHTRTWRWIRNSIQVIDNIDGNGVEEAAALFHFHPSVQVTIAQATVQAGPLTIHFSGNHDLKLEDYHFATGFNRTIGAQSLRVLFHRDLTTTLSWSGGDDDPS